MSCESIHESNRPCTIPGRHDMQHGYQEPTTGQWVFWEEAVRRVSTRDEPTTAEIEEIIDGVTQRIPNPFPQSGNGQQSQPAPVTRLKGSAKTSSSPAPLSVTALTAMGVGSTALSTDDH